MKAVLSTQYGPPEVLQITELEKPVPLEGQVLVKVKASSVNAGDYRVRTGKPFLLRALTGWRKPKITRIGSDIAGVVEAVGVNVEQFQPGDEVFGYANGAFAEYALTKEANLVLKPPNRSFQEAATLPVAGLTALQAFRYAAELRAGIQPGQKVLVQGASGGVGVFAVQLAKSYGAEVTAVCSTRNLELARAIGANHVIDYTQEDFTRRGEQYDLILGINGYHSLAAYKRALRPQGVYVCVGGSLTQIFQAILLGSLMSRGGDKKLGNMGIAKVNQADLAHLGELLEAGTLAPVIDCSYPLSGIVAAMRYVEETHVQGKVAITMA